MYQLFDQVRELSRLGTKRDGKRTLDVSSGTEGLLASSSSDEHLCEPGRAPVVDGRVEQVDHLWVERIDLGGPVEREGPSSPAGRRQDREEGAVDVLVELRRSDGSRGKGREQASKLSSKSPSSLESAEKQRREREGLTAGGWGRDELGSFGAEEEDDMCLATWWTLRAAWSEDVSDDSLRAEEDDATAELGRRRGKAMVLVDRATRVLGGVGAKVRSEKCRELPGPRTARRHFHISSPNPFFSRQQGRAQEVLLFIVAQKLKGGRRGGGGHSRVSLSTLLRRSENA